jgi:hypothetical protein
MYVSAPPKFLPKLRQNSHGITPELGKTRPLSRHQPGMTTNHLAPVGHCSSHGPPVDVFDWRLCRLLECGFPSDLAHQLASTPAIDIHALLQLVDRGCPPELAARILSPIGPGASA